MFWSHSKKQAKPPMLQVVGPAGVIRVDSAQLIKSPKARAQIEAARKIKIEGKPEIVTNSGCFVPIQPRPLR